ncbi:hypothetical protein Tco_0998757 [Tanacetum coccineum]
MMSWEFIIEILTVSGSIKETSDTNEKEYMFAEADFPNLNQNDIEDLFLLKIQNKIRNIKGVEEYDLINALQLYIRKIMINKRVEDVHLGVESYQTKLNLTKPQLMKGCSATTMKEWKNTSGLTRTKRGLRSSWKRLKRRLRKEEGSEGSSSL